MFKGCFTALVTPFKDGVFDESAFEKFVSWQIDQGIHGLVPCGTTGEASTLTEDEYRRVIEVTVRVAAGRVPVIAGSGTNSTAKTIHHSQIAEECGVDGLLVVAPYYNKPTQEGLYQHFAAVHDATSAPIVLYNIPGRSVVEISVATLARLAKLERIVGVKDATTKLDFPLQVRRECGASFAQLSGEDGTSLAFLVQGGVGTISVTSNMVPKLCAELHDAWFAGDIDRATELNNKLQPLREAAFFQSSPSPAKYGLELLGHGSRETRLPLVPASEETQAQVKAALKGLGVLS